MPRIYDECEATYLRSLEAERIEMVGPTCEYYSLNRGKNVDALYGEPTNDPLYGGSGSRGDPQRDNASWNFYPDAAAGETTLTFPCVVQFQEQDNRQPSVRDEGFHVEDDAECCFSRDHWERAIADTRIVGRAPKEGDVIYVFDQWWDVVQASQGGNILDTPVWVGYKVMLKQRSQFTPDRKVA